MTVDISYLRRKAPPPLERIRHLFRYDRESGLLIRRVNMFSAKAGESAGTSNGRGLLRVGVDGERYLVHLVIWYMVTGEWPASEVDHKDTDGANNRWDNLRLATRTDQMANRNAATNNKCGFKGVCLDKRRGLYKAEIMRHGKSRFLGYFSKAEDAYKAYQRAAVEVHGEFARVA